MDNIKKCECVIGIMYDYDDTDLMTRKELEEEIKSNERRKSCGASEWYRKFYTRNDYCDKRITTNLKQFDYCPFCGKKINWKAIKDGANG